MKKRLLKICTACKTGSCCREGVELNKNEIERIEKFDPPIKKPWFKLVDLEEYDVDPDHPYEMVLRNKRCVFQGDNKRCLIYSVRPRHCAEFPLESGKIAEYYEELCDNKQPKK